VSDELERWRIFAGHMPQLLRDIVAGIVQSRSDMEIVGRQDEGDLSGIFAHRADVMLLSEPAADRAANGQSPPAPVGLKVVKVIYDERGASLFEVGQLSIAKLSPQMLIEAIIAAMGSARS
jgi:hypothetical protein